MNPYESPQTRYREPDSKRSKSVWSFIYWQSIPLVVFAITTLIGLLFGIDLISPFPFWLLFWTILIPAFLIAWKASK